MKILPPLSLGVKIMLGITGVVFLLGAFSILLVQTRLSYTLKKELAQRGVILARELAASSVDLILTYNDLDLHMLVHSAQRAEDVRYAFITDGKGKLIVHTFEAGFPYDLLPATTLEPGSDRQTRLLMTEEGPLLDAAVLIYGGSGVAHIGMSYENINATLESTVRWLILDTIAASLLGLLAAFTISGLAGRPIRELMAAARELGSGNFARRANVTTRDEIGQLGAVFNTMAADLERSQNELLHLQEAVAAINESLDLDQVLRTILRGVTHGLGYERATLALIDEKGERLRGVLTAGHEATVGNIDYEIADDEGLLTRVCRTGQPLVVRDAQGEERIPAAVRRALDLQEVAIVPITASSKVLGVIVADRPVGGTITDRRMASLSMFAGHAAVAIANARLFEDATIRTEQLTALNTVASAINESLDPDEMMGRALDGVLDWLRVEAAGIMMWNDELGGLSYQTHRGFPQRLLDEVAGLQPGEGIAGRVFATGEAISLDNISADERLTRSVVRDEGFRCFCCVPVICRRRMLGVMTAGSRIKRLVSEDDLSLLTAIGQQLGVAIEQTRLLGEASKVAALRQLNRMKSEFVARASHELRTPVTSLSGYVETLLRRDMVLGPELQREMFEDMYQVTDRLSRLVHDLLNVSRIDVGKLEIRRQQVDVAAALSRTVRRFASNPSGHVFRIDTSPSLRLAMADPDRLDDVLDNLVSNAVKYSPDGGTVTLAARAISPIVPGEGASGDEVPAREIVISVSDQGVGIRNSELDKLFDRFYQSNHQLGPTHLGIGLGLYLCKTYVEAIGGRIWVESVDAKGSTFHFTLPMAEPPIVDDSARLISARHKVTESGGE